MEKQKMAPSARYISIISILVIALTIGYYIYLLHTGRAQALLRSIQAMGVFGVLIGIILQAVVNIFPVPGEFTSIVLMEIYGPIWGALYSWIGGIVGATGGLYLVKWIANPFLKGNDKPVFEKIEQFIKNRKTMGLLFIRFVPLIPYHFVNYAAGLLKVQIWPFVWTTAIGLLPYTIAMSGIYAGVRHGSITWGIIGAGIFVLLACISFFVKKRNSKKRLSEMNN